MKVAAKHLAGFALLAALQITMLCLSVHLAWRPLTSNSLTPIAQFAHSSPHTVVSLQCSDGNDDATPNLWREWLRPVTISMPVWSVPQPAGKPHTTAAYWDFKRIIIVHRRTAPRAPDDDALRAHLSADLIA